MAENRQLLDNAQRERDQLLQQLSLAQASAEAARADVKAVTAANEQLRADVVRGEEAVDALEKEHRRFVAQASELCGQKDAEIAVSPADDSVFALSARLTFTRAPGRQVPD